MQLHVIWDFYAKFYKLLNIYITTYLHSLLCPSTVQGAACPSGRSQVITLGGSSRLVWCVHNSYWLLVSIQDLSLFISKNVKMSSSAGCYRNDCRAKARKSCVACKAKAIESCVVCKAKAKESCVACKAKARESCVVCKAKASLMFVNIFVYFVFLKFNVLKELSLNHIVVLPFII